MVKLWTSSRCMTKLLMTALPVCFAFLTADCQGTNITCFTHEPMEQAVQSLHCMLHAWTGHPGHDPWDWRPEFSGCPWSMQWLYTFGNWLTNQGQTERRADIILLNKMVMLSSCHLGRLNLLQSKLVGCCCGSSAQRPRRLDAREDHQKSNQHSNASTVQYY